MADFDDLSEGEKLAHFGGDVDAYTDYHNGVTDEYGNSIDHDYEPEPEVQDPVEEPEYEEADTDEQ